MYANEGEQSRLSVHLCVCMSVFRVSVPCLQARVSVYVIRPLCFVHDVRMPVSLYTRRKAWQRLPQTGKPGSTVVAAKRHGMDGARFPSMSSANISYAMKFRANSACSAAESSQRSFLSHVRDPDLRTGLRQMKQEVLAAANSAASSHGPRAPSLRSGLCGPATPLARHKRPGQRLGATGNPGTAGAE